jgi:SAM-dependent methyltransferase
MALLDEIRTYWDVDAQTYDLAPQHRPRDPFVQATWTASLERLLPPPPARVLDCGAGTGFLSLIAARLGHEVTAIDLSPVMVERLGEAASHEGLEIEVIVGSADQPPGMVEAVPGSAQAARAQSEEVMEFDVVMERHLLWTLPKPDVALRAWRTVAPHGRLLLVESMWGSVDPVERLRSRLASTLRQWRGQAPDHHAEYDDEVRAALPLGTGTPPARLMELVSAAGWRNSKVTRLRDVEWSERRVLPIPERLVGLAPRYVVVADA